MKHEETPQQMGGRARADKLTDEQKTSIARKAALARWEKDTPRSTHEGSFMLGESMVYAAVLPNRQRLLTQATFLRALGRSVRPKAGTGVFGSLDGLPSFLQAEVLKPFITEELLQSTTPVFFIDKSGKKSVGYDAKLLPNVADVYLKYRDARAAENKAPDKRFRGVIQACDAVMRGLASFGIVAMIDKATGFTDDLEREIVTQILEAWIVDEMRPYVPTFPVNWFKQLCRLKNIEFRPNMRLPRHVGKVVNDLVYDRLGYGLRQLIDERTPVGENGRRRHKKFQNLTEEMGIPQLLNHLGVQEGMMLVFGDGDWKGFYIMLNKRMPPFKPLPLFDQPKDEPKALSSGSSTAS